MGGKDGRHSMTKRREACGLYPALLCFLGVLTGYIASPSAALAAVNVVQLIPSDQAQQHIGETTTVCGMVASGKYIDAPGRERTYLNFDRPYPNQTFAVVIPGDALARFKTPPETLFQGKTVCVTGLITAYRGKPEMTVDDPSQITIQGEAPTFQVPSNQPEESAPAPLVPKETPSPAPPAPSPRIASADAQQHVGENATVCGPVVSARYFNSAPNNPTLLNFDRPYPNHTFTVVIPGSARARFNEAPETMFRGKTVCVTGLVTVYKGKPEIVVVAPSQIVVQ
jgi:DNA/RNA endonuclease YhcR with UshA esterase domain